jgi:hypothetical protein
MARYKITVNMDPATSVAMYPSVDDHPELDAATRGGVSPYEWTDLHHPPTSSEYALALSQAIIRWTKMIDELTAAGTFRHFNEAAEGVEIADHQATSVSFEVMWVIDPLPVYQYYMETKYGNITGFDGNDIDTNERVVKQMVTAGICFGGAEGTNVMFRKYNPRRWNEENCTILVKQPDVPAKVFQDITVEVIS